MTDLPERLQAELNHLAGEGVVVRYQFGDRVVTQLMDENTLESELWQDVAFTNGAPLQRIVLEFAPEEAKALSGNEPGPTAPAT